MNQAKVGWVVGVLGAEVGEMNNLKVELTAGMGGGDVLARDSEFTKCKLLVVWMRVAEAEGWVIRKVRR